jgi:amidophosphoribosyltransferase
MDGVRRSIGADTLGYVSIEGLVRATEQPASRLCAACFDGKYPIPLPDDAQLGKHVLEEIISENDTAGSLAAGYGAAGAMRQP